jgi:hypothetical protein
LLLPLPPLAAAAAAAAAAARLRVSICQAPIWPCLPSVSCRDEAHTAAHYAQMQRLPAELLRPVVCVVICLANAALLVPLLLPLLPGSYPTVHAYRQ